LIDGRAGCARHWRAMLRDQVRRFGQALVTLAAGVTRGPAPAWL